MSYVSPAVIPDADFRERWASHEWENKIAVRHDGRRRAVGEIDPTEEVKKIPTFFFSYL